MPTAPTPEPVPVTPSQSSRFSIKALLIIVGTIEVTIMLGIWLLHYLRS